MVDLLPFLTSLIGLRDPHGKAHSNDVKELCSAFGRKIEMTSAELETLTFAAQIHDIGKIAIIMKITMEVAILINLRVIRSLWNRELSGSQIHMTH